RRTGFMVKQVVFTPQADMKTNSRSGDNAIYIRLSWVLFAALAVLVLGTFRHYGLSWDEPLQHEYGEKVFRYYTSFFRDRSSMFAGDLVNYGGSFEFFAVLATR